MRAYVFYKKGAQGDALIAFGKNIHEAIIEIEKRSGHKPIMSGPLPRRDAERYDPSYLNESEIAELGKLK